MSTSATHSLAYGERKTPSGFDYVGPGGRPVRDSATLARIKSLAVPPAWTDVWISPLSRGHIQASGRDARGRKQYRYHPRWREARDRTKFERMVAFAEALPAIRGRAAGDLASPGLPREKVLAAVVRLLETTLIRVGNREYARENNSFGLTTLRNRHVGVNGSTMRFEFRGKGGRKHEVSVRDRRLANLVRRLQDLPGQELFQYIDEDGRRRPVGSADVNAYLRETTGEDFSAKDFRTWTATVLAALTLCERGPAANTAEARRNITAAVEAVARGLGNTPSVCRQCYIHPEVFEHYERGALDSLREDFSGGDQDGVAGLYPEEAAVLRLLRGAKPSGARTSRAPAGPGRRRG
ncbi:MAG TPA: DNA topoisomerase IB [Dehalococcoidia bacterium]|nr:DNA topoisomerase IB [Dehalococcoidia bacterium]